MAVTQDWHTILNKRGPESIQGNKPSVPLPPQNE